MSSFRPGFDALHPTLTKAKGLGFFLSLGWACTPLPLCAYMQRIPYRWRENHQAHKRTHTLPASSRPFPNPPPQCSQAGHWERALALLADMRKQGIRPSRVTYTAAVVGINRRRYGSWAPKLANLARLLQNAPGTEAGDGPVDAARFGDVEIDGGERGSEGGDGRGPSAEELDCSIEALGNADDAGGAKRLLGVMRQEGFHASPRAYRSVIYACARVGLLSEAMALAKEMHSFSSGAVATQQRQQQRQQHISLSSGNGEEFVSDVDVGAPKQPPAAAIATTAPSGARSQTSGGSAAAEKRRKSHGLPSEGVSSDGDLAEDGAAVDSRGKRGVVSEDEDGAEFDIAVVYNCIICNFARAATGGCSTVSHACDPRGGREAPEATVLATAEKVAAEAAAASAARSARTSSREGSRSGSRSSGADVSVSGAETEMPDGDVGEGEGLVAMLLGVADRAEGSLTQEAANGGVELSEDECSVPL